MEIDERNREKRPFTSYHELYGIIRMPFGLKNAPAAFQRESNGCNTGLCTLEVRAGLSGRHSHLFKVAPGPH